MFVAHCVMINNLTILKVTIPLIKSLGYIRVQGTEWDRFKNPRLNTSDLTQWSGLITCIESDFCGAHQKYPCTVRSIIGLRHEIADTFSRLSCSNESSPLVGKKAANDVSDSESNNRNESLHSLLMNDGDIVDCLMNLLCLPSRKKKDRRPMKHRKCTDEQNNPGFHLTSMIPL